MNPNDPEDDQNDPNPPPAAPGANAPQAETPPPPAFNRNGFRDAWMGSSGGMSAFQAAHPEYAGVQEVNGKSGVYRLPSGEIMDLQIAKGAMGDNAAHGWTGVGEVGPGGAMNYYGAGGAGGGQAGGSGGSAFQNQIRQQLLTLMGQANQPIDENSADIAQPFAAAKLEASRGQDAERKALAEMLFAQGGGNVDEGQLQEGVKQSMERNAVGLGGIKAQLIGRALQNQMQKAQQALSLAVQSGDAESARSIQMQIAQMDSQLRRYGMDQQQSQFNDQFGLEGGRFQYQKDKDAALYGGG